ncbi:MAG: hypothetical protein E7330_06345 [Clostridiales bacterium]|nr:hypothetical protein [Clostridiales bacterium]
MMEKFRRGLSALRGKTAAFLRAKGYYIALTACIAVVGAAAAVAFLPAEEEEAPSPAPSDAPVAYSNDERLAEALKTPAPAARPSPTPAPTPMPDFTAAPERTRAPQRTKASPPVRGEIIWGYAVDSLLYSRTLDQWMTHPGVDVAATKGTAVHAVFAGTVERVYSHDAFGVTVEIASRDGITAQYANLAAEPPLREGAKVNAGDTVGTVGDTAVSECGEKSHLHFGLYVNGESADPQEYVLFDKSLE